MTSERTLTARQISEHRDASRSYRKHGGPVAANMIDELCDSHEQLRAKLAACEQERDANRQIINEQNEYVADHRAKWKAAEADLAVCQQERDEAQRQVADQKEYIAGYREEWTETAGEFSAEFGRLTRRAEAAEAALAKLQALQKRIAALNMDRNSDYYYANCAKEAAMLRDMLEILAALPSLSEQGTKE